MRKFVFVLLIFLQFFAMAQAPRVYYLKAVDKPEYQNYLNWCNDSISVNIVQYGKATFIDTKTLGLDYQLAKAIEGDPGRLLKDSVWFAPWRSGTKTARRIYESNDYPIKRVVPVKVPRRLPSVPDFYASWKTGLIKR